MTIIKKLLFMAGVLMLGAVVVNLRAAAADTGPVSVAADRSNIAGAALPPDSADAAGQSVASPALTDSTVDPVSPPTDTVASLPSAVDVSPPAGESTPSEAAIETSAADTVALPREDPPMSDGSAAAPDTLAPVPLKTSNYYGGSIPSYQGMQRRGVAAPASSASPVRKLKARPDSEAITYIDSSTGADTVSEDTLSAATASRADIAVPPSSGADSSRSVPVIQMNRRAKIITAIGTSAVIGGVVTFFIVKTRTSDELREREAGIPDPPAPPGYW